MWNLFLFNSMAVPGEHILHSGVQLHGLTSRALDEPWILFFYLCRVVGGAFLHMGNALCSHIGKFISQLIALFPHFSILEPRKNGLSVASESLFPFGLEFFLYIKDLRNQTNLMSHGKLPHPFDIKYVSCGPQT